MRGIPDSFQTKQDIINTHKLAMRRQVDKDKWLHILNTFITPNKYVLPILKNEGHSFYIPYTELPLPPEYSNNKRVSGFIDETSTNSFTKPTPEPENGDIVGLPGAPSRDPEINPRDVSKALAGDIVDMKQNYDGVYQPELHDPIDPGFTQTPGVSYPNYPVDPNMGVYPPHEPDMGFPEMNPDMDHNRPQQTSGGELPMLKVYADVDPQLDKIEIFYGYPVLEDTRLTKEDILKMIKELS